MRNSLFFVRPLGAWWGYANHAVMTAASTKPKFDHFKGYPRDGRDEMFGRGRKGESALRSLVDALNRCGKADLRARQARLDRGVAEMGLYFNRATVSHGSPAPSWRLDIVPRVLPSGEWDVLTRGVIQRARVMNAYIEDLHGDQRILRDRVIPCGAALRDPAFHRSFSGLHRGNGGACLFGAFDLARSADGVWRVSDHHLGTPFGVSHVLQNRRLLSQVFPELFAAMDVAPVADFTTRLAELLRARAACRNPHVLLLTQGTPDHAFFEEGFLARHLGISIARPGDLLVRENGVFLKTIRGLERVDVIYRRLDSSAIDPVSVPNSGFSGVPGLVNVVRKGNVEVINGLGAGVADNRALFRHMERLTAFYLGEKPFLKTVETYHLGDPDQREMVAEEADRMVFKPVQDHESIWRRLGWRMKPGDGQAAWRRLARRHPEYFVAQPLPESSRLPCFEAGGFQPVEMALRVYFLLGDDPMVLPGGLSRRREEGHRPRRATVVTAVKDTWVPQQPAAPGRANPRPVAGGSRFSIGSRTADALYWAGRYVERAESTARHLHILENLRWDQLGRAEKRAHWPLLRAVASATGQTAAAGQRRPPRDTLPVSAKLLLDGEEPASVLAAVHGARRNFDAVRETISPECRQVWEELVIRLRGETQKRVTRTRLRETSAAVVNETARFNGFIHRTMPRDDGWQFYQAGLLFERAAVLLALLGAAMPLAAAAWRDQEEESTDLTALLLLCGSLDAYRRQWHSRACLDRVAAILLVNPGNPASFAFCLRSLRYALGTLSINGSGQRFQVVPGHLDGLIREIENWPLAEILPASESAVPPPEASKTLRRELNNFANRLDGLHAMLEDVYFNHQYDLTAESGGPVRS